MGLAAELMRMADDQMQTARSDSSAASAASVWAQACMNGRPQQQVLGRVAGERQFGRHHHDRPLRVRFARRLRSSRALPARSPTVALICAMATSRCGARMMQAGVEKRTILSASTTDPAVVDASSVNTLLEAQSAPTPFMRHEYLGESAARLGSAVPETGWQPRILTVHRGATLRAACASI